MLAGSGGRLGRGDSPEFEQIVGQSNDKADFACAVQRYMAEGKPAFPMPTQLLEYTPQHEYSETKGSTANPEQQRFIDQAAIAKVTDCREALPAGSRLALRQGGQTLAKDDAHMSETTRSNAHREPKNAKTPCFQGVCVNGLMGDEGFEPTTSTV